MIIIITLFNHCLVFPGLCSWFTEIALGESGCRIVQLKRVSAAAGCDWTGFFWSIETHGFTGNRIQMLKTKLEEASTRDGQKRCWAAQLGRWRAGDASFERFIGCFGRHWCSLGHLTRHNWSLTIRKHSFTGEPTSNQDEFSSQENHKYFWLISNFKGEWRRQLPSAWEIS